MTTLPIRQLPKALVLLATLGLTFRANATDWLQFGYDQAHSGNNTAESGYSTPTGNQRLYTYYPSPSRKFQTASVYAANVATPSAKKNLLFTVSRQGELLALNAADGTIEWSRQPIGSGPESNSGPAVDPGL
jgi:outer membrane protein assembly factor BamB